MEPEQKTYVIVDLSLVAQLKEQLEAEVLHLSTDRTLSMANQKLQLALRDFLEPASNPYLLDSDESAGDLVASVLDAHPAVLENVKDLVSFSIKEELGRQGVDLDIDLEPAKEEVVVDSIYGGKEIIAELIKVKYIGEASAKKLAEQGYTKVQDITLMTIDNLVSILGIDESRAAEILASAKEIAPPAEKVRLDL